MKRYSRPMMLCALFVVWTLSVRAAKAGGYIAYISDSTNSSVITWIAKEAGIFKKHGLDLDTIFINGSVRGIQSLIAGDLGYSGAVGTAVINAKLAGGDIAIIQSQMNTLPYFIIGNANIKSPEALKGRAAAVHIPGTSADFAMRLALTKVGIPYKDIKAVTVGGAPARLAAVTQGQTDFTVVTDGERIQGEKLGLKVIIDMAKLNVPFQFNCVVTTRRKIRESRAHAANSELLAEDTYPTLEGLKQTLEVQALTDPRANKAKAEDLVDLRFVDEMKKSGFVEKLYGRK
jgi:ABC-type nitrate/sulfonate/bicarbonate transport system substrate-binding protein